MCSKTLYAHSVKANACSVSSKACNVTLEANIVTSERYNVTFDAYGVSVYAYDWNSGACSVFPNVSEKISGACDASSGPCNASPSGLGEDFGVYRVPDAVRNGSGGLDAITWSVFLAGKANHDPSSSPGSEGAEECSLGRQPQEPEPTVISEPQRGDGGPARLRATAAPAGATEVGSGLFSWGLRHQATRL